jgi:hypothetical protein
MRSWLVLLAVAAPACAQPFSFGVKAGVPLTDFFNAVNSNNLGYFSTTNRYIIGGTAELRLPFGFGVEFDALYRHLHYTSVESFPLEGVTSSSTTSGEWEFPLLLKYRFHFPLVRPYVDGGVAWDTLSGLTQSFTQTSEFTGNVSSSSTSNPGELQHNTVAGVVFGTGVDIHALVLHILPEIRYTRWINPHFQETTSPPFTGSLSSTQNQLEFLVGFTF